MQFSVFAVPYKVVSDNVAENNATIELKSRNFTSNLTITYWLCSEASSWTTLQFQPPVVHLVNLTADTTYCYSIAYNGSNTTADGSCGGTFNTTGSTSTTEGNSYHLEHNILSFHFVFTLGHCINFEMSLSVVTKR